MYTDVDRDHLVGLVRRFAQQEVKPLVRDYDRDETLPMPILARMAELGFYGGTVPEKWGGAGLDHVTFSMIIEEMSRVDHCLGVLMSMPSALVGAGLLNFGTDEQRKNWLMPLARGEIFGGAAVTEPGSGSDVAGLRTTYRRDGEDYILNGSKTWISNLDIASFFLTFASADLSQREQSITAFLVPADTPGLSLHPIKNKLGFRPLCSGEVVLDDVRLGPDSVIGPEREGFGVAMTAVERGRLTVASRAIGLAQLCLDSSIEYANSRVIRGTSIGNFQLVQGKIANMATEIKAARLVVRDCAQALDRGGRCRLETSMAKMFASDVLQRAATEAVQIFGGHGVSDEHPVARAYRDAKVFQIVEGTNEIHRTIIAKQMLGNLNGGSRSPSSGQHVTGEPR